MNVTTTWQRVYRIKHQEVLDALDVNVGEDEEASVSANDRYVFITIKGRGTEEQ